MLKNGKFPVINHLTNLYDADLAKLEFFFNTSNENSIKQSKDCLNSFFFDLQSNLIRPNFFFEIGAFTAQTSAKVKIENPKTQCFAFEANIYNFNHFSSHSRFKDLNVNYLNLAISDQTKKVNFFVQKSISGSEVDAIKPNNSLLVRNQANVEYEKVLVQSYQLDDFIIKQEIELNENSRISLWIDVEGAGLSVLKGAELALNNTACIFIEVEEKKYWKGQALSNTIMKYLIKKNFIPIARDFETPFQYNVMFIKQEILLNSAYKTCRTNYFNKIKKCSIGI